MKELTTEEAYLAMYSFLEKCYEQTKSDDIGALLGGMAILNDGVTADPAFWAEWQETITRVKNKKIDAQLKLMQSK